jgi:NAD(P)-dependent dehydrogenase (short-subunit alcohol dehydrogenase family)
MREPRTALVTGASGGLGAALTAELQDRGWTVYAASRSGGVPLAGSPRIHARALDVGDEAAVTRAVGQVLRETDGLDLVVANAGINVNGVFEEISIEHALAVLRTNLLGVAHLARAVLPGMRARRRGTVLVIGSLAGMVAPPGESWYAASKHALEGLLEALQYEVRPFGVRVLLAQPGFLRTGLVAAAPALPAIHKDYEAMRVALQQRWNRSVAGGGDPSVVAQQILDWAERPGPGLRRRFGADARWLPIVKHLLPESMFFAVTHSLFGLGPRQAASPAMPVAAAGG